MEEHYGQKANHVHYVHEVREEKEEKRVLSLEIVQVKHQDASEDVADLKQHECSSQSALFPRKASRLRIVQ